MKVAIITDTHFGARKGSQVFHEFFQKFYDDIFFPTLEERGIKTYVFIWVMHLIIERILISGH